MTLPLAGVTVSPGTRYDPDAWYRRLPVVARLRSNGLTLDHRVTVLAGENGSGKSTLVEALAAACGRRLPRRCTAPDRWLRHLTG